MLHIQALHGDYTDTVDLLFTSRVSRLCVCVQTQNKTLKPHHIIYIRPNCANRFTFWSMCNSLEGSLVLTISTNVRMGVMPGPEF